jgi:hypothetical protein
MRKIKPTKKQVLIVLGVLLVIAGVLAVLEKTGRINLIHSDEDRATTSDTVSKTTSTAPTAQSDFTGGDNRTPQVKDKTEATVTDNNGSVSSVPPASQWTNIPSGAITLYTPAKNGIINNGDTLAGKATVSSVSFRLIDDVSGVIAQGQLAVKSENYSGTFNFTTSASEGRLDVFNTKADGTEQNVIEVPVRFR